MSSVNNTNSLVKTQSTVLLISEYTLECMLLKMSIFAGTNGVALLETIKNTGIFLHQEQL